MLLLLVVAVLVVWPLVNFQFLAFADDAHGIRELLEHRNLNSILRNTIIIGFVSATAAVVIGTSLAWTATRLTRRARKLVGLLPLLPLMLPSVATVVGWAFLYSPDVGYINRALRMLPTFDHLIRGPFDIYSMLGILVVQTSVLVPFVYIFVDTGIRNMGQEYEKAAAASGASPVRQLFKVSLPLLRPSIIHASIVALLVGLGTFTVPLFLGANSGTRVLTTEMYYARQEFPIDYGYTAALATPLLVLGAVVILLQRRLLRNQTRFVVAPGRTQYPDRARSSLGAIIVLSLYSFVAVILPAAALVYVSFTPYWSGNLSAEALTLTHFKRVLGDQFFRSAFSTSLTATVGAIVIVLPLGYLCARALSDRARIRRIVAVPLDIIVTLPLGLPAALFGLGLLYTYTRPPLVLYGTTAILVIAYVALMIPHATRLSQSTLISLGHESIDAARASHAGHFRTFFRITAPLMRKGFGAAAALIFILMMGEFSASLMVRSPRSQVLGTLMWDAWSFGTYPLVAVVGLVTLLITVAGVVTAMALAGRDAIGSL